MENKEITRTLSNFFIPEGVEEENYILYKTKLFRVVPPKTVLIKKNVFTGTLKATTPGLKVVMPWYKSKFLSTASKNIDYPEESFKTDDGIFVNVDPALTVKVTNPVKFELENLNPIQELGVLAKSVLRSFIASKTESDLTHNRFTLEDIDPRPQDQNGNVYPSQFEQFAQKYGITVTECYFKNIELPQSLKDDYEKAKAQEKENARLLAKAQNALQVAEIEAQTLAIESQAKAKANALIQSTQLERLIEVLTNSNMSMEQIQSFILANGTNPNNKIVNILGQNNSQYNNQSAIIAGVETANETLEEKPKVRTRQNDNK